jgi:hypothetical protein
MFKNLVKTEKLLGDLVTSKAPTMKRSAQIDPIIKMFLKNGPTSEAEIKSLTCPAEKNNITNHVVIIPALI